VVIILETEIWPNFLRECRKRGAIVILANGRMSNRSFQRYKLVKRFIARVFADLSLMVMQSAADVARVLELGAEPRRVRLCGNLKYDISARGDEVAAAQLLGLDSGRRLIVAGSTAAGEEEILLSAFRTLREDQSMQDVRLLVAPRHPERFDEVAELIARTEFSFVRRSAVEPEPGDAGRSEVVLLDSIGELAGIYRVASVVFVGGSLVPRGGHNVLEPAAVARPIIVGPHTENFRQIIADFLSAEAIVQIKDGGEREPSKLAAELARLLADPTAAKAMGERALELVKANQGAADCTLRVIKEALSE
jgi:3-deoxy-D-manno-octulosonic-acid transferase